MSNEFANWPELAKLWHTEVHVVSPDEVERRELRLRRQMLALAGAEAAALVLVLITAVWIAMHTAFVALSAVSVTFFGICAYLQYRMRREPPPAGDHDLMASLEASVARENWVLAQLGVGRAVTLLTFAAIAMVGSDHLRFLSSTPAERLWAMLAIALIVIAILGWNLVLTYHAKRRRRGLLDYTRHLCA